MRWLFNVIKGNLINKNVKSVVISTDRNKVEENNKNIKKVWKPIYINILRVKNNKRIATFISYYPFIFLHYFYLYIPIYFNKDKIKPSFKSTAWCGHNSWQQ